MTYATRHFLLNAILLSTLTTIGSAQNQQGIYVGRPKVFDHRTLQLMLEDLNAQLAGLKSVDQASVNGKTGGLQGMEIRETSVAGSIGIRRPYTRRTTEDGKVTDAEVVPGVPGAPSHGLGDATSVPMGNPAFNMSAQDVLSEQINLQYQIFNLRMITDRSLTDRIEGAGSKLQAVLGIPVSLDPSREALDSAAIVKVTVRMRQGADVKAPPPSKSLISVVALMPQEKTYNSATLNKSAKAFSGSAIAKVVQVGFTATKRGQTYFLYRDNDTISFEHPVTTKVLSNPSTADDKTVVFGWQFRPVLGRRSVAPGMRQMFAVVALPTPDDGTNDATLEVTVETRWVKYQRSQLTVYPNTLWYEKFGESIGKPRTPPRPDDAVTFQVTVPTTESYQTKLAPTITEVGWSMVGTKDAIVNVQGSNFLSDTKVIMGGKTYDAANGIKIKSEKAFDLVIDTEGFSDAVIQGRYGNSAPLLRPIAVSQQLRVERVDWPPPIDRYSSATIYLGRLAAISHQHPALP